MLEYDRIEIKPAPNRFFDQDATLQDEPSMPASSQSVSGVAYLERVQCYERELDKGYRAIRYGSPPGDRYPHHDAVLPGQIVTIVYDGALDRRLLQIYALAGWNGIRAVQAGLDRASKDPVGKRLRPWDVVASFFTFARNRLLLLTRAALIGIERKAADEMVLQLSLSARMVNDAWTQLDVRTSTTDAQGKEDLVATTSPSWDTPVYKKRPFYKLGNRRLSNLLYPTVLRAVQARDDVAAQQARRARLQDDVDYYNEEGSTPPSGTVADLAQVNEWLQENEGKGEPLYEDIYALCPLAVLAVPLLTQPASQAEFEQTLGRVMAQFHGEAERLARGFNTEESWLTAVIPAPQTGQALEQFFPGGRSAEEAAAEHAIAKVESEPACLSLLSERTLETLVASGSINKDSFDWVVLSQYVTQLHSAVEAHEESARDAETAFRFLNMEAALLSIALWATPAGPVARGISAFLGIGLVTYQCHSVIHELARLDLDMSKQLIDLDRRSAAAVANLSELARKRPEYVNQLTEAAATEVALIAAAGAWPEFKQFVHLRGYYFDLETLVGK